MAGLRRAPPVRTRPKGKPLMPLHQRILGKAATEFDEVEDLRYKLERAWDTDNIEWDVYNACHDALDIREAKARLGLRKATGRHKEPDKPVKVKVVHVKAPAPWPPWKVKMMWVFIVLVIIKILSIKP